MTVLGLALTAAVGTVTVGARVSVCDARALHLHLMSQGTATQAVVFLRVRGLAASGCPARGSVTFRIDDRRGRASIRSNPLTAPAIPVGTSSNRSRRRTLLVVELVRRPSSPGHRCDLPRPIRSCAAVDHSDLRSARYALCALTADVDGTGRHSSECLSRHRRSGAASAPSSVAARVGAKHCHAAGAPTRWSGKLMTRPGPRPRSSQPASCDSPPGGGAQEGAGSPSGGRGQGKVAQVECTETTQTSVRPRRSSCDRSTLRRVSGSYVAGV